MTHRPHNTFPHHTSALVFLAASPVASSDLLDGLINLLIILSVLYQVRLPNFDTSFLFSDLPCKLLLLLRHQKRHI